MTQQGTVELSDVQKLFNELPAWDKAKFLGKNLNGELVESAMHYVHGTLCKDAYDAVQAFNSADLIEEIEDYVIEDYIFYNWTIDDIASMLRSMINDADSVINIRDTLDHLTPKYTDEIINYLKDNCKKAWCDEIKTYINKLLEKSNEMQC